MAETQLERLAAKRKAARAARDKSGARETAQSAAAAAYASPLNDVLDTEDEVVMTAPIAPRTNNPSGSSIALPMQDMSRVITSKDVTIPRLFMAQSMSKVVQSGDVPLGNWYHNSRNRDLGKEVTVILADFSKSRSYFVQGAGVMCSSYDMVQGMGTPGGLCDGTIQEQSTLPENQRGCPLRLWDKKKATPTNPSGSPECGENYTFAVVIIDGDDILRAMLTLRKTGISAAKKLISAKVEEDLEWTDMAARIRINSKQNPRGTFQVPEVTWIGDADDFPEAQQRAIKLASMVNSQVVRATLEATSE